MGVACSPDLANLFGFWFESRCSIWSLPWIGFYGRYIDDCIALVYASSAEEAINLCSSTIAFNGCVIEWEVSSQFAHFLDMTIYIDGQGSIQHMPYRKAKSHQERIPWISHHSLDVRRGTFIGEMSRLATLSSTQSHYVDAIKGLAALYIKRGYPSKAVYHWLNANKKERWEKRLSLNHHQNDQQDSDQTILVLKSTFNTAWDYFDASELGKRVTGYWKEWLEHAEKGQYSSKYPNFRAGEDSLKETQADLHSVITDPRIPAGILTRPITIPDVRLTGITEARWLVSRKRTRNMFDLASSWKKEVIHRMEIDTASEIAVGYESAEDNENLLQQRDIAEPGDLEYRHYNHAMNL